MIDTATFLKFCQVEAAARTSGRSLPEVLDEKGLLLTPARLKTLRLDVVTDLYRALEEVGIGRLLTPEQTTRGSTPAEAHRAILEFIEKFAAQFD